MIGLKIIYRAFIDRRKKAGPVMVERRRRLRARDAEFALQVSIERLSSAIKSRNPNITEARATVTFATFSEVCNFRVPKLQVRMCRHPKQVKAGVPSPCNEGMCPFMNGTA